MNKTRRLISESLKGTDLIIEIVDARVPQSSRNPMIAELTLGKKSLVVLNKSDLADPSVTSAWLAYFNSLSETKAIAVSCTAGKGPGKIAGEASTLIGEDSLPGNRPLRALVVGIPNVGKSTIINKMLGRKKTETGNKPAVTRDFQRVMISNSFEIFDTPGLLWHKFEDQETGYRLAILGSIKDSLLDFQDIAGYAYRLLRIKYPERVISRYKIESMPEDTAEGLTLIGRKRGFLLPGGIIDYDRACRLLVQETRDGKLGPVSLDDPPEAG